MSEASSIGPLIDEKGRRREDFLESTSVPVTFKDGQEWYVPKPMVRTLPTDDEIGYEVVSSHGEPEFDAEFNKHFKAVSQAIRDGDGRGFLAAKMRLYRCMLGRNYNLPLDELRMILYLEPPQAEGELDLLDDALWSIANGHDGPKARPAGDALGRSLRA
jgi:hypothetical protein